MIFQDELNATMTLQTEKRLTAIGYHLSAFFLLVIGILGIFNNIAVFVVMAKNKQLRSPINLILLNLALSDLGICAVGTPVSFLAAVHFGWSFNNTVCVVYAFLMSLFGIASITTLTVLSFERYLMISHPFRTSKLSNKSSFIIIVGVWSYALLTTFPPLTGWGAFVIEGPGISCSVDWETRSFENTSYIIYMFILGLGFPLIVMGFSYTNIVLTMRQSGKSGVQSGVAKAETRVAIMVMVMWITFLLAWTPYAVFALLMAFGNPGYVTPGAAAVPALVAKSSCIYNPVIYVGLNTQFRSAWKDLFCCAKDTSQAANALATEKLSLTLCTDQNSAKTYSKLSPNQKNVLQGRLNLSDSSKKGFLALPSREETSSEWFSLRKMTLQLTGANSSQSPSKSKLLDHPEEKGSVSYCIRMSPQEGFYETTLGPLKEGVISTEV